MKILPRLPKIRGKPNRRIPKAGSFHPDVAEKIVQICKKREVSFSRYIVTVVSEHLKAREI